VIEAIPIPKRMLSKGLIFKGQYLPWIISELFKIAIFFPLNPNHFTFFAVLGLPPKREVLAWILIS